MRHITQHFFLSIILALLIPVSAYAAVLDLITTKTTPRTPGENQDVTVNIESYAVNLNSANIIWYVNKEVQKEGIAEKILTLRTGNFGQKMTIDIIILTAAGEKINKQLVIAPAEIDVLWEAQTYTPPFYKGKALPSFKSLVRVTAIPRYNSLTSNPSEYYYKWTYNRTQNVGAALGKNSVVVPAGWSDSQIPIALETNLPGVEWSGIQNANIHGAEAKVLFYEQAPLLGTQFEHALTKGSTGAGNEFVIRAVPYFFSTDNYQNNQLIYTWKVNGNNAIPGSDPITLTLTKPGKKAEAYTVSLRVQNPNRILQEGRGQTTISLPQEN